MHKLDPYAEGFLRTCYEAGLDETTSTLALLKRSSHDLLHHGKPLDNVSRTILAEHGRLHRTQVHQLVRSAPSTHPCF